MVNVIPDMVKLDFIFFFFKIQLNGPVEPSVGIVSKQHRMVGR